MANEMTGSYAGLDSFLSGEFAEEQGTSLLASNGVRNSSVLRLLQTGQVANLGGTGLKMFGLVVGLVALAAGAALAAHGIEQLGQGNTVAGLGEILIGVLAGGGVGVAGLLGSRG